MGVRDYDAKLSQFWTPDPKFLETVDACVTSPVECNLYGYAKNNPLSFVDPRGTESEALPAKYAKGKEKKLAAHKLAEMDHTGTPVDSLATAKALKAGLEKQFGVTNGDKAFAEIWPGVSDYIARVGSTQHRGIPDNRTIYGTPSTTARITSLELRTGGKTLQVRDTYRKSIALQSSHSTGGRDSSAYTGGHQDSGGSGSSVGASGGGISVGATSTNGWQDSWASTLTSEATVGDTEGTTNSVDITVREEVTHIYLVAWVTTNNNGTEKVQVDLGAFLLYHQHNEAEDYDLGP
jgi:hypothetical protein